jgi:antitoxin VapB
LPRFVNPVYTSFMNRAVHTKTFKSGNSVAVRLPKALGFEPDETFELRRQGDMLVGRRIPTQIEQAERKRRWLEALDKLRELGPVGEVEVREPIEFPDRPGL